jgi:hypothetical protein
MVTVSDQDPGSIDNELARGRYTDETLAEMRALIGTELRPSSRPRMSRAELMELVYELLDAHTDTADLAARLCDDERWAAHLDYLRSLQRVGRQVLAGAGAEPA